MTQTPYEEINELVKTLKQVKEITLEGTDSEYFSKKQLLALIEVSKGIIAVSEDIISSIDEEEE